MGDEKRTRRQFASEDKAEAMKRHRVSGGAVGAFYAGYEALRTEEYPHICKIDADLLFGPDYFQRSMEEFDADPKRGAARGDTHEPVDRELFEERTMDEMVAAQLSFGRRACRQQAACNLLIAGKVADKEACDLSRIAIHSMVAGTRTLCVKAIDLFLWIVEWSARRALARVFQAEKHRHSIGL